MTEPDKMIEAVARALCDACGQDPDFVDAEQYLTAMPTWERRKDEARAAISALDPEIANMREALAKAYIAGATDVHIYWRNGGSDTEPDFAETAYDYANDHIAALGEPK